MPLTLRSAISFEEMETARLLLREYAAYLNQSLGEDHICLDSYDRELAGLPGPYAGPWGTILLAYAEGEPAGCAALKPLQPNRGAALAELACEMKRLWVRPAFRGQSIGLALAEGLVAFARRQGYIAMHLDTVPAAMKSANSIYRKMGFVRVERYSTNPILGSNPSVAVEFFRLSLG